MGKVAKTSASVKPPSAERLAAQRRILAGLKAEMPPVRTVHRYAIGLMAVSGLMLLLPVAYLGLMGLIAHAIYWNVIHNLYFLGGGFFGLLAYLGFPVVGTLVLLFMVKPIFARNAAENAPQPLSREDEPFFFEYVEAVCDAVGAPYPRSIRFECDVNASAGLRRGWLSLFLSDDLVLNVGAPLVTGLTVKQLTAVLAHEFGHFAQRTGLRASYVVRTISFWFFRVTFERDIWDDRLVRWSTAMGWWSHIILSIARVCIWLTRVALFGLAWVGSAISFYFTRQMEFDADRYEASVVEYKTIRSLFGRMLDLTVAQEMAMGDLQRFWQEGRLPDDFAALVVSNIPHLTPEIRKQIRRLRKEQTIGLFDTHPSDDDRLAAIRESRLTGGFRLNGDPQDYPATILFQDFGRLSRAASAAYYRAVLGPEFDRKKLHSAKDMIATREQEIAAYEVLDRFFQVRLPVLHPIPLDESVQTRPDQPLETAEHVRESRERMLLALPEYKTLMERYDAAEKSLFSAVAAQTLSDCELPFNPQDYGLPSHKKKAIRDKVERAQKGVGHLAGRMLQFETEAGARLASALQLLQFDSVTNRIADGENLRDATLPLLPEALFFTQLTARLRPVRVIYHRLTVLGGTIRENENREPLIKRILQTMTTLHDRLKEIAEQLGERMYPFDHADATMTLRRFLLPAIPGKEDLPGLIFVTQALGESLTGLQVRLFARLAVAAERVETALGLPPLPQPKPEEPEHIAS